MASNGGRTGAKWREARKAVLERGGNCGLCGEKVDVRQPYKLGGKVNPISPSVNHIVPLEEGGSLYELANLELAHSRCQSQQGADITNGKARRREDRERTNRLDSITIGRTSRQW